MIKISTLGPSGTFSDIATHRYIKNRAYQEFEICYFESIKSALKAIGEQCDIGILPIENFSEGFIPIILDELIVSSLTIVAEIVLPIRFALVSQTKSLDAIERLFVQFVAKGQCSDFIETLPNVQISLTESNIESFQRCVNPGDAAIVPDHVISDSNFDLCIENINDYNENKTRFLVLSDSSTSSQAKLDGHFKTSIIVLEGNDSPGLLGDVLAEFSNQGINLTSIISRPTRTQFGKYHFFIDFDGAAEEPNVAKAIESINKLNPVKVLGSYKKWLVDVL